jgi:hypothetical protein
MAVTAKVLINAKYASSSSNVEYTVPVGTRTIIDKFTATNTDTGAVLLTVWLIPSGGSEADSTKIIKTKSIAAAATSDCTELQNQILAAGDTVKVLCDTASKLAIRMSGREIT